MVKRSLLENDILKRRPFFSSFVVSVTTVVTIFCGGCEGVEAVTRRCEGVNNAIAGCEGVEVVTL